MKKYIPLELSVAQRLAAVQLENPFCGFCRAERAAVDELKVAMALSPTGRSPSQPALPGERVSAPGTELFSSDFTAVEERVAAHYASAEDYRSEGDGIWLRRGFLRDILQRTGKALGKPGPIKLLYLPEAAQKLRDEFDQAQATIKEMGELIDQQAAELQSLRDPGKVTVSRDALARVIWALEGAPHLIRELQMTRGLPGLPVNPIDLLVEQLRSPKAE